MEAEWFYMGYRNGVSFHTESWVDWTVSSMKRGGAKGSREMLRAVVFNSMNRMTDAIIIKELENEQYRG
jgi:hypothetical protein